MYVRLAFGVAAHLESEILIIDEVLAVGDAEFQKKCIGKMSDVSKGEGRTVLFVSHNMAAIKALCSRGIILQNGRFTFEGNQAEAINYYQNSHNSNTAFKHAGELDKAPGNQNIRILSFEAKPYKGEVIQISSGVLFELFIYNYKENINLDVTFELRTLDDTAVFHHGQILTTQNDSKRGVYKVAGSIPENLLNAGYYKFSLIFGENQRILLYKQEDVIQFEVMNEQAGSNLSILPGIIRPTIKYTFEFIEKFIIG